MSGPQRQDPAWNHAIEIKVPPEGSKKGYKYLKCNYCSKEIKGGVKRVKDHLAGNHNNVAPCSAVPDKVKKQMVQYLEMFKKSKHSRQQNFEEAVNDGSYAEVNKGSCLSNRGKGNRGSLDRFLNYEVGDDGKETHTLTPVKVKEHRNLVCLDIGRFFFENGIPFNVFRSPSFVSMVRSIGNYGRGLKPPSMHELRNWILNEEEKTTSKIVDDIKATWKDTGVSLLSDGWSDMRNRSLINFLVNNQHGTMFLKTVDASDVVKDAQKLFELLDEIVVEIGEEHVVQVITDNTAAYKAAGRKLMDKRPHLYWTPCAAHCIDLMLEKIGELPQHKNALLKAKRVTNFIQNHQWVLSLTRKFAKKDLLRPAATRFATAYLTLESMYALKQPLQQMYVSKEWAGFAWAKKDEGKAVKRIIMSDSLFWSSVVYCIKTTQPLVDVLRLVDGERTPAMGFIYAAMDEAKEKIKKNFNDDLASYKEIWSIIDEKWDKQLHVDLHASAYYLNPRFKYENNFSTHPEIKRGLFHCMERMLRDDDLYLKVDVALDSYINQRGFFGSKAAKATYSTRSPVDWWEHFGDEVPELKAFAKRILGLCCSASACERNWSTFNQVHTKKRNRLTTIKLNKLVYIMYNKKLKHRHLMKQSRKVEEDPLVIDEIPSDDEWVADPNDEVEENEPIDCEDDLNEGIEGNEGTSSSVSSKRKRNEIPPKGKEKVVVQGFEDEDFDDEYEEGSGESGGDYDD